MTRRVRFKLRTAIVLITSVCLVLALMPLVETGTALALGILTGLLFLSLVKVFNPNDKSSDNERRRWGMVSGTSLVAIALVVVFAVAEQEFRTKALQRKIPRFVGDVERELSIDKRFVAIGIYYNLPKPAIAIHGTVKTTKAFDDLERIVANCEPPMDVSWHVTVEVSERTNRVPAIGGGKP